MSFFSRKYKMIIFIISLFLLFLPNFSFGDMRKIDGEIVDLLENPSNLVDVIINLRNGDSEPLLNSLSTRLSSTRNQNEDPGMAVYSELRDFADLSQRGLLSRIDTLISDTSRYRTSASPRVKNFWISNIILIQGADRELIRSLSDDPDVESIDLTPEVYLDTYGGGGGDFTRSSCFGQANLNHTWGLERVRAPEVWKHTKGGGVVVGILDTGVRGTHEILRHNFVGKYGWYAPLTGSDKPADYNGHGSHVTGTAVGKDLGIAPDAKWMACSGSDSNGKLEFDAIISCMQFMLCPTLTDGSSPNCNKRPHIISNSWGSSRKSITSFTKAISAWRASQIIPLWANGNDYYCNKSNSLSYADTIGVGNLDSDNSLKCSSSKGPAWDGSIKPDVAAPGTCIYSSGKGGDDAYFWATGTSMATPNVAGVIALLLSAKLNLTFDQIRKAITKTANRDLNFVHCFDRESCGGIKNNKFPNNHFGHGLIDAFAAYKHVTG